MVRTTVRGTKGPFSVDVQFRFDHGEEVLVMTPAELEAKMEEARAAGQRRGHEDGYNIQRKLRTELYKARGEVPEGFDVAAIHRARVEIEQHTGQWPKLETAPAQWLITFGGCGDGWGWCRDHGIDSTEYGPTPLAAAQSLLAAVQAAAAPKLKPVEDMTEEELEAEAGEHISFIGHWPKVKRGYAAYEVRMERPDEDTWCFTFTGVDKRQALMGAVRWLREEATS